MSHIPTLKLLNDLPPPADDSVGGPGGAYAFFYAAATDADPHLLVYERARDFLSAPRAFVVLAMTAEDTDAVELNSLLEYDGIDYDADGVMQQTGCFQLVASAACYGQDQCHFILSVDGRRCEILCREYTVQTTIYHVSSACQALRLYLAQQG
ncbi:hypothetical protein [Thalassolituus pacificus]|uniref:Uncharacterized protein n=1 Tax=Thalassolituus pacificus TaxID=2975440 RepID=A0A9X3ASJ2_9GAMM|nr:hypothetical protein [Thalassolituus pacificus]MCT7360485.1 hypothetical protein [Thalassolituus pacificus]